jgi:hypothetical protein
MESEKPLHDKTKHNTIFTSLLEFTNQLLLTDGEALPKNAYKAKKFLRHLGLGYGKILACQSDCILFWKDIEHLDLYTKCGLSKWKDNVRVAKDGQS